ncbi:hypothetical protein NQ317_013163 [Molorchus minor]|uniref:Integrase catalytic domain-containing protein n=1 Tax=Molorchus minor TaxID=1323400 RepID=A0ABQ9JXV4_9CUCU|nr:hypothetical protein NQ317_013163 [Molorchus minor]
MDLKFEINRLEKDELTYELAFRGITDKKTVEEMRKCLRAILKLEKAGSSLKYPTYPYTFTEDGDYLEAKILELQNMITAFSDLDTSSLFIKISSKLMHAFQRANRAGSTNDEEHTRRSSFLIDILNLQGQLKSKAKKFKITSQNTELPIELSTVMSSTTLDTDSESSDSEESVLPTPTLPSASPVHSHVKSIPVSKWSLNKFSGDNSKISLSAFLENVEELCVSRNVTKSQLFNSASDLFTEKALTWFRSIKNKVHTWSQLVEELRLEFQSPHFNEKLLKEIKQRTQGPDESIGIYIAVMTNIFNRLTIPINESARLKIILPNLAPFYQSQLTLIDIHSIEELVKLGRKLEARKETIESFVPPPRNRNSLIEPDLAYIYTDRERPSTSFNTDEIVCWNCKGSAHAEGDERPYLEVSIFGTNLLGLLDSGATNTIIGNSGWKILRNLQLQLDEKDIISCTVANDRIKLIKVFVIPALPHTLILGADFWRAMEIVPDLRHGAWKFSDRSEAYVESVALKAQTTLTPDQSNKLFDLVDKSFAEMGNELGCTTLVEHEITTLSSPIKQRYYPPEQKRPLGLMLSSQTKISRPFELLCADLVGPLPRSKSGYQYIFVIADCFSKFPLLFPLRTAKAPAIVKLIEEHVFLVFGCPRAIIVDNGVQFRSKEFVRLMKSYTVTIKYTALYHPQANPCERINRVLKTMLRSFVSENHRDWDSNLARVGGAIRSTKHEVTGLTPNFINFGREISLKGVPLADEAAIQFDRSSINDERTQAFAKIYQEVKLRLSRAYDQNKNFYDLRRRDTQFLENELVWRRNYVLSDKAKYYTAKLAPKFVGPFMISKRLSPWTYELKDLNDKYCGVWHAKDLKAHPPDK